MNCYQHADQLATAFCRSCGRGLCTLCQNPASGTMFCPEHVPDSAYSATGAGPAANPYTAPPPPLPIGGPATNTSPALAFILGLIPGVGAIYNGQYVKGLTHAVVIGLLMSLASSLGHTAGAPLFVLLTIAFWCYMPFEAYHTARKRQLGLPMDEWSSLISGDRFSSRAPIGPVLLIVLGVLFLLDSLDVLPLYKMGRFWPVLLIVVGGWMLYSRLTSVANVSRSAHGEPVESSHER